jgi:hypothetical protein
MNKSPRNSLSRSVGLVTPHDKLTEQKTMKLVLMCFLFALCPLLASATVITSGTITLGPPLSTDSFDFSGPGFSVSGDFFGGGGNWGYSTLCAPCVPGQQVGISGIVVGNDLDGGNATVNGTNLGFVRWGDNDGLHGTTLSVVGPNITLDAGPGTYRSTFNFSGTMCGTNGGPEFAHPCLVDLPNLTGSGVVDATFVLDPVGNYKYTGAVYTFTATPEPRTWMLALIGILPLLAWRRKMAGRETAS